MIYDLNNSPLFPKLTPSEQETVKAYGEVVECKDREVILREGEPNYPSYLVLSGRVRIFRNTGSGEEFITNHEQGNFTGEVSVITGGPALASAQVCGDSVLVRITSASLRKMLADNSPVGNLLLKTLCARARQMDSQLIQEEKLAALGKMSAGLAHELNNPATAARRAAKLMLEGVLDTPLRMLAVETRYSAEQKARLRDFALLMKNRPACTMLDPLEMSDHESTLLDWLEERQIPRADEIAPVFASAGLTLEELMPWVEDLGPRLVNGLYWLETVLRLGEMARDIETSTDRIVELVGALKEYTYMDQARFLEIDIHQGIENTLKIMHHKLKMGVTVRREYAPDLPKICAYPGEVNQVWTNLIDNAIDAMDGKGTLTIRTAACEGCIEVEISDTGKGIPENIRSRIFEPFFTTKAQGKGTGLGLDITYRIAVLRHNGSIQVKSVPGHTTFCVRLPLEPQRVLGTMAQTRADKLAK